MKENKKNKQPKQMNKINTFISKINNVAFVSILLVYTAILLLIVVLISPKYNYIITPTKEHITVNEAIYPQLTLKNQYSYNNGKTTSKLSILAKLTGDKGTSNVAQNYTISSFKLGAYTTNKKMEYFTEQSGYKTPITHSYTLTEGLPDDFYINIKYKQGSEEKTISTYEDIWLKVGSKTYVTYNTEKPALYTDVDHGFRTEMRVTENTSSNTYSMSLRVAVDKINKDFHMDVQTWLVPEDNANQAKLNERFLIGIYGYSSDSTTYTRVDNLSVPKADDEIIASSYIYCKVFYYEGDSTTPIEVYYKYKISDCLGKSFTTNWSDSDVNTGTETPETGSKTNKINKLAIACIALIITGGITSGIYVIYNKKRNKKIEVK